MTKNTKKGLVEEAMKLKVSDFGKGLLKATKSGEIKLNSPHGTANLNYHLDLEQSPLALELEYDIREDNQVIHHSQVIELMLKEATYGTIWLFKCPCGRMANILYLPRDKSQFLCRNCHDLTYEICRLNKNTMGGLFAYTNRLQKLMEKRESIDRLFYGNRFTSKARSFFKYQEKWGFGIPDEVKRLAELQIKLNSQDNFDGLRNF